MQSLQEDENEIVKTPLDKIENTSGMQPVK